MTEDVEPTTPRADAVPEAPAVPWLQAPAAAWPEAPAVALPQAPAAAVALPPAPTEPPPPWPAPPSASPWTAPSSGSGWTPPTSGGDGWMPPTSGGEGWMPPSSGGAGWIPPSSGGAGWMPPTNAWMPGAGDPWGPHPLSAPPVRRRARVASVIVVSAAMIASALFGVGIGRAVNHNRTTTTAAFPAPSAPLGGSPGAASGGSTAPLGSSSVSAVEAGVVDIDTKLGYQSASAAGTGMILTADGEILTNNHVIDGATTITATVVATGKTYSAKVVGTDVTADVAVLQLKGASGLTTIPLGSSSAVAAGDAVVAIGNAGGVGGAPSVVSGTVQATGQAITASDQGGANAERLSNLIETNAPIQPGDSGGPLVNANGRVIGMDTAASAGNRFQSAADVAFAIPIDDALSIVHQIEAGKASATIHLGLPGFLGVEVQSGVASGGSATSGVVVSGVVSGSPAASAGIRTGDVITGVDGQAITVPTSLTTQLQGHHPGDKVSVTWTDTAGSSHTATVTLMTGPAN